MERDMTNPKAKRKPRFWKSLPKEDKEGIVRELLEAGYTREAVGDALGTTKNAVVGYQHTHLPDLTGRPQGSLEEVPNELLKNLLAKVWPQEETADHVVEQSAPTKICVSTKLTSDWREQCGYSDGCGYKRLPGMTSCGRPGHDK